MRVESRGRIGSAPLSFSLAGGHYFTPGMYPKQDAPKATTAQAVRPFQIADVHHRVGGIALAPFDVWLDVGWRHQPDLMCQGLISAPSLKSEYPPLGRHSSSDWERLGHVRPCTLPAYVASDYGSTI